MKAIVAAVLGVASLAGAPALAADITLEVPLLIENVPSATQVIMYCQITSSTRSTVGAISTIVRTQKIVPIPEGGFNGIIRFEFSGSHLADADGYICTLGQMNGVGPTGLSYATSPGGNLTTFVRATGQSVVRTVMRVSGTLP